MKRRDINAQRAGSLGRESHQNNPPNKDYSLTPGGTDRAERGVARLSLQISVVFKGSLIFLPIPQKTRAATVANLVTLPVASMGECWCCGVTAEITG